MKFVLKLALAAGAVLVASPALAACPYGVTASSTGPDPVSITQCVEGGGGNVVATGVFGGTDVSILGSLTNNLDYTGGEAGLAGLATVNVTGGVIDFGSALSGTTVVGFFDSIADSTSFFEFDLGSGGALSTSETGTARLYQTVGFSAAPVGGAVPEPSAWALMLVGFGGLGAVLRRARGLATQTA